MDIGKAFQGKDTHVSRDVKIMKSLGFLASSKPKRNSRDVSLSKVDPSQFTPSKNKESSDQSQNQTPFKTQERNVSVENSEHQPVSQRISFSKNSQSNISKNILNNNFSSRRAMFSLMKK